MVQVVCSWGRDRVTAALFSALSCVYFTYPSSPTVLHDFAAFVVTHAADVVAYARSDDEESYSYYRCGNGRIPRKELLVKGMGSLMQRLGEDGNAAFLKLLLSSEAGEALLSLLLAFLESGSCPQHEVVAIMTPLRCGINRLKDHLQSIRRRQQQDRSNTPMSMLEHTVTRTQAARHTNTTPITNESHSGSSSGSSTTHVTDAND
jgi:hypothetical protein